jgi:hypothetical protein
MTDTSIDRAQEKRRLVLAPFLATFFVVLAALTAPTTLALAIGIPVGLALAPLVKVLIDWSERGHATASAATGALGAVIGTALLRIVLPHDATVMFAISLFGIALCTGLGLSAWSRLQGRR